MKKLQMDFSAEERLELDEAAIIWSPEYGFKLLIPKPEHDDDAVADPILALTELFLRFEDPEFVSELVSAFDKRANSSH